MKKLIIAILLVCALVAGAVTYADIQKKKAEPEDQNIVASLTEISAEETEEPEAVVETEPEELQDYPEQKATAEKIAAELQAIENKEEMMEKFFALREEYCADPGKESYPDGYYFQDGQMVEVFENAVKSLEDYEVSDPVQSEYGYHVIVKLPLDADQTVQYTDDGTPMTARALFANDAYGMLLDGYVESTQFEVMDSVKDLNVADYVIVTEETIPADQTESGEEETVSDEVLDYDTLYASHSPEETVIIADGREVSWDEYYFWVKNWAQTAEYYMMMYSYYGMETSWADFAEGVTASAQDQVLSMAAIDRMAAENGVELTEEEKAGIQEDFEASVAAEFEEVNEENIALFLEEQGLTKEMYDYVAGCNVLYSKGLGVIFGENGANIPDEDAIGYLTENGFMHAAHILISTTDLLDD